jgi:hypothetical protein
MLAPNDILSSSDHCKARGDVREAKPRATQTACTVYTILHILIDVHRSYVPFWLLDVVGPELGPDNHKSSVYNS